MSDVATPDPVEDPVITELSHDDILDCIRPMIENLERVQQWIYGTDTGYLVVAVTQGRTTSVYQAVGNAAKSLRIVRDSIVRRQRVQERS